MLKIDLVHRLLSITKKIFVSLLYLIDFTDTWMIVLFVNPGNRLIFNHFSEKRLSRNATTLVFDTQR